MEQKYLNNKDIKKIIDEKISYKMKILNIILLLNLLIITLNLILSVLKLLKP